ncbi:hypothetical protein GOBAR_DD27981 [Gossypium barbadense]|nr:hypothetical protein GOBAR_DD27981 [Gossypium barbadense]
MGLDTPSGGNTSHGYYTPHGRKVSSASIFFESLPYKVNPQTGYIDYEKLEERALDFRPKILICGEFSNFPESVVALAREKAAELEDFSPTSIISTDAGQELKIKNWHYLRRGDRCLW